MCPPPDGFHPSVCSHLSPPPSPLRGSAVAFPADLYGPGPRRARAAAAAAGTGDPLPPPRLLRAGWARTPLAVPSIPAGHRRAAPHGRPTAEVVDGPPAGARGRRTAGGAPRASRRPGRVDGGGTAACRRRPSLGDDAGGVVEADAALPVGGLVRPTTTTRQTRCLRTASAGPEWLAVTWAVAPRRYPVRRGAATAPPWTPAAPPHGRALFPNPARQPPRLPPQPHAPSARARAPPHRRGKSIASPNRLFLPIGMSIG